MGPSQSSEDVRSSDERIELLDDKGNYELVDLNSRGKPLEEFYDKYELTTDVLGKGAYAEVRLARENDTGKDFAVKIMLKSNMDEDDLLDMRKEVGILQKLNHRNIVKVLEYFEDNDLVYIVMEYLSGGELYSSIEQLQDFTETDTRAIIQTLLQALKYCKDRGIIHRDIKPDNILLRSKVASAALDLSLLAATETNTSSSLTDNNTTKSPAVRSPILRLPGPPKVISKLAQNFKPRTGSFFETGSEKLSSEKKNTGLPPRAPINIRVGETSMKLAKLKYDIVLADFGFATQVAKHEMSGLESLQTQCGTPIFVAPEIIVNKGYNYKCDVWSVGVVAYMLLSGGQIPFPAKNTKDLYAKVLRGQWEFQPEEPWKNVSDEAKDFIKRILVHNVEKRADYEELLVHPWLTKRQNLLSQDRVSVNFDALKLFNARRKVLKCVRAKQAALTFQKLMHDLERKSLRQPNPNLDKYLESVRRFYLIPEVKTMPEIQHQTTLEPVPPTPKASLPQSPPVTTSTEDDDPEHAKASRMKQTYLDNMSRIEGVEKFLALPKEEREAIAHEINKKGNSDGMTPPPVPPKPPAVTEEDKKKWKTSTYFKDIDHFI